MTPDSSFMNGSSSSSQEIQPLRSDTWEDEGIEMLASSRSSDEFLKIDVEPLGLEVTYDEEKPRPLQRRLYLKIAILLMLVIAIVITAFVVPSKNRTNSATAAQAADTEVPVQEEERSNDVSSCSTRSQYPPFSTLDPVEDLSLPPFQRPSESSPSSHLDPLRAQVANLALPTNAWYQNLLLLRSGEEPTSNHRAYAVPYVVDAAGAIPGLRIHSFRVVPTSTTVTLAVEEPYSLTLGATAVDFRKQEIGPSETKAYSVTTATDLGVTLEWVRFAKELFGTLAI
jgi:hypothetical protein